MIGTMQMSAAKTRKQVPAEPITAQPKTEMAYVSHPTLGFQHGAQRVVDSMSTLRSMVKRDQISERQYQAAERYGTAHATLYGAMGGVMDYERARGGSSPGAPPSPSYLIAAETDSQVRRSLYPRDYAVVYRVVALGMSIEEAAANLTGQYEIGADGKPTRAAKEEAGRRLRAGLAEMADWWFPQERGAGAKIRAHVGERAASTGVAEVPKARAVHATGTDIYRTGKR